MTGAMYAAIGGLKTHMSNLNVIGNNISNVNTVGYKAQRMTFQESIYTMSRSGSDGGVTVGGNNPSQVGYGAQVGSIDLNMAPGTYAPTGFGLDCMMMGEGFFAVGDKDIEINGAADLSTFTLTRVGDFWKDAEGFITDRGGSVAYGFQTVQNPFKDTVGYANWLGYNGEQLNTVQAADCDTIVSAQIGPLKMPIGAAAPTRANGGLLEDGTTRWDEGDPVYDLMGPVVADEDGYLYRGTVSLTDIVTKAVANTDPKAQNIPTTRPATGGVWSGHWGDAAPAGKDVWYYEDPENPGCRVTLDSNSNVLKIEFRNGTGRADGGMTLGTAGTAGGAAGTQGQLASQKTAPDWPADANYDQYGTLDTAQYTADAQTNVYFEYKGPIPNKDALPIEPSSMTVTAQGGISCQDSNGNTAVLGYLAVLSCASNDGVTHIGECYYKAMEGAGDVRVAGLGGILKGRYLSNKLNIDLNGVDVQPAARDAVLSGGTNEIKNAGLEASSTDIATEFSNMIITQRGYQANTRIVTVTDSMLEELVNMKR